jgi:hypothetical protein
MSALHWLAGVLTGDVRTVLAAIIEAPATVVNRGGRSGAG